MGHPSPCISQVKTLDYWGGKRSQQVLPDHWHGGKLRSRVLLKVTEGLRERVAQRRSWAQEPER